MGVLLGLVCAVGYGISDFVAGVGGRRASAGAVTLFAQPCGLVAAVVAVAFISGSGPTTPALAWGAVSGVGSGLGTVTLYRGLAVGQIGVVSPVSAVLTAALPALVGIGLGERPSSLTVIGILLAVPAAALVSRQPAQAQTETSGLGYGVAAGLGFGLLFVALDQAGTASGAWPLLPGQLVAVLVIIPLAMRWNPAPRRWRPALWPGIAAGLLGGIANLVFLAATGVGQLAVVAVLTALYPAVTVLLARVVLNERWRREQVLGLVVAVVAIILITAG